MSVGKQNSFTCIIAENLPVRAGGNGNRDQSGIQKAALV
jgi:hypothetical protein